MKKENVTMKILSGYTSQEKSFVVENYPYGFTLRTKIRYWIESNKKGDRFISQTLNPKTNLWNKPKASTYSNIVVLCLDEKGYTTCRGLSYYSKPEDLEAFLVLVGQDFPFNEFQQKAIKELRAIYETRKYIKFECINTTNWTAEQKEAHEAKQKEIKAKIGAIYQHELSKA